jgi:predicted aldo/keto reductase-like oxidoreductase
VLYRELGSTQKEVSILGFGAMRLPTLNGQYSAIDEEKASEMLKYAIEDGVNYIDTAYPYHDGKSEVFLGNFFKENPELKEEAYIATKMPSWLITKREDMGYYLEKQLENLKTENIDFYLLHSLKPDYWGNLKKLGVLEFLDSAKEKGIIKYAGFSFHGEVDLFMEIIDAYPWDVCQIQFNYMDENYQAGREGLRYAADQGMGTIIMEPLRGGCLARNIPPEVQEIWELADEPKNPAEWALKYIWDYPEVNVVLSGMSTREQVQENIQFAADGYANSFSRNDKEIIKEVKMAYREKIVIDCNECGYCMPCPQGVNIPRNFSYLNYAHMFNDPHGPQMQYYALMNEEERASNCSECEECKNICPQMIHINEKLKDVVKTFEK